LFFVSTNSQHLKAPRKISLNFELATLNLSASCRGCLRLSSQWFVLDYSACIKMGSQSAMLIGA